MKILWLCGNPGMYHSQTKDGDGWIGALQKELLSHYLDVELVNVFRYDSSNQKEQDGKVTYYPIQMNFRDKLKCGFSIKNFDRLFLQRIMKIIQIERPDIIHCWGSEMNFGLISSMTDIPVVLHIQGLLNPYLDAFFPPKYNLNSLLKARKFNVISFLKKDYWGFQVFKKMASRERLILSIQKNIIGRTIWDKSCAEVLSPNAEYFYCSESLRTSITSSDKWKWHNNKKLIVSSIMSGALYKGVDVILRTSKILKDIWGDNFAWNIYGINDIRIHENITGIKAKEVNVFCRGRVTGSEISKELLESDVYCHESYIENSPNSVCEAQYLGVPVVAAMVGGVDTIIKEGSGILVPANDAYRSATSIISLKRNKQLSENISSKEICLATERHKNVSAQLMNIYKKILENR